MKYIPTLNEVTKEIVTYGVALVVVAFIIAKSDKLKRLVKEYSL